MSIQGIWQAAGMAEQFISGLNDNGMINEILKIVDTLEDIEDATSKFVFLWACRIEAQRVQKLALNDIEEERI